MNLTAYGGVFTTVNVQEINRVPRSTLERLTKGSKTRRHWLFQVSLKNSRGLYARGRSTYLFSLIPLVLRIGNRTGSGDPYQPFPLDTLY